MKTEIEMKDEEVIQKSKHLAPIVHARDFIMPGDEQVIVAVPRNFNITLSDGTRQRIQFTPGTYPISKSLAGHGYLAANGVQIATVAQKKPEPMKTEETKEIDYKALTAEALEEVDKMDQLKAIYTRIGGDVAADIKSNTSKADVRVLIVDLAAKKQAEKDAAAN